MKNKPLLSASKISKSYRIGAFIKRRKQILSNIDIDINKGEIVGCVGESGSGKSTLSRIITLLEKPDTGKILFEGQPADTKDIRFRKSVQMVFQNPINSFDPTKTIGKSMKEPFDGFSMKYDKEKIELLFDRMRLPLSILSKKPYEISGGMAQRAAIARSLVADPKLLVLDEATSSLDATIQFELVNLLFEIQEHNNISFFVVSHDLELINFMTSRVYVIYDGRIVESGNTKEVYNNPQNKYTKKLLK